jgi:acetyltransferase
MTIRNLNHLFQPKSVVFVGASERPDSIGLNIATNLLRAGFAGDIRFVNKTRDEILGQPCYHDVSSLPFTPSLAIVATPPKTVPGVIDELGRKGCRAAIVITAGVTGDLAKAMLEAARPYLLRIIGPNCIGVQLPNLKLDASFSHKLAKPGHIALVSQSGALATAMLDWASVRGVGFSHVVSIGDAADIDLGDMLDYLAGDVESRAVFLYIEGVRRADKFMSAARRCARAKPVIAIKSGRHPEGAKAAASHTGALAGADSVYDAALRRAGILRVLDLSEIFEAAEVMARVRSLPGSRLAIVTNGGGAGVLAADTLVDLRGTLPALEPKTMDALNKALPPTWSHGNPVDIIGDAPPHLYRASVEAVMQDTNADVVLVMNCPTALASSIDAAKATVEAVEAARNLGFKKPVVTNWLSQSVSDVVRPIFAEAKIPDFDTPAAAVRGIMQLARYGRAQQELMQTPPALPAGRFNGEAVEKAIAHTLKQGRDLMTEPEAKAVLSAYGIPTSPTRVAATPEEARRAATDLLRGYSSVVVKILSPNLSHKSDIGGVRLDLTSPEEVERITQQMLREIRAAAPNALIEGVTVQPMIRRPKAYELILGITTDPTFGPVVLFGAGGTGVEAIGDTAMSLTPLDLKLAGDLIKSTRVYKLLKGYRDKPPVDLDGLALCLIKLSSLAVQHRAIRELDINPLLVDSKGMIALDARIKVEDPAISKPVPCAIRPYPAHLEEKLRLADGGEVLVRPIRPDDERFYHRFFDLTTPEDIRLRLFAPVKEFSHSFLARMTQIDYAREIAFIALRRQSDGSEEMLGVVRFFADPDYEKGEYAVLVRSDLKGLGLGWLLMRKLIGYAKAEGLKTLYGKVLCENTGMLKMCRKLGFSVSRDPEDESIFVVTLDLTSPAASEALVSA